MKIKKYVGKSFQDAFEQMKRELGSDAVILNSRKIKEGGILDFLGSKEIYEITAAIDTPPAKQNSSRGQNQPPKNFAFYSPHPDNSPNHVPHRGSISTRIPGNGNGNGTEIESKIVQKLSQIDILKDEISEMKKVINEVAEFLKYSRMPAMPEAFKKVLKNLVDNEVQEELAKAIVQTVYAHTDVSDYRNPVAIEKNLIGLLDRIIKIARPLESINRHPYVVTLVGPTGVGKTTTIAKLAANLKMLYDRKVALISADTYRIAAIEQLQTFANIAGIPMSIAYSPEELRQAIYKFRQSDVILIDTVGRSQKNDQHLRDLQKFIDAANPDETHLVLSMTSSLKTLMDVVRRFSSMRPNRIIFSKLDESPNSGNMLNILYKYQLPVSYITTGQTVPNDILTAEKSLLINLIYKGVLN